MSGAGLDTLFKNLLERDEANARFKARGGSVGLNSLRALGKWISALATPLPGLASAG